MRLKAAVVVDLGSLAHRVGEARGIRYAEVDLVRLATLLGSHGVDITALTIAGPFLEARLGIGGDESQARRYVAEAAQWWDRERAAWQDSSFGPVPLRRLMGGTTGTREVGVDVLVAAAALEAAGDIAVREASEDETVLICSHDSDLFHLHRVAAPVRLFVAGAFTPSERARLREQATPHIQLQSSAFAGVDRGSITGPLTLGVRVERLGGDEATWPPGVRVGRPGDHVVVATDGGDAVARSTPLNRCVSEAPPRREPLADARTVAAVDPYGLANAAVRSIGVARLPRAVAFQALVASLGWDHPVAVYATIPDLDPKRSHNLATELKMAWRRRDADLDELADAMAADGDPMTQASRSLLQPDAVATGHPDGTYERDLAAYAIKRMATGLIADVWLAATTNPEAQIVVCSDDPDLTWALDIARRAMPGSFGDITRIGIHARRYRVGAGPGPSTDVHPEPGSFVVLTDTETARLVGVHDAPFGRRLRHAVHRAVVNGNPWSPGMLDPETGARTVRTTVELNGPSGSPDEHAIEAHLFGGDLAVARLEATSPGPTADEGGEISFDLAFDPHRPCAHPVLTTDDPGNGSIEATVVAAGRGRLAVDINGNGAPDTEVDVAHDFTMHKAGTTIVVRRQDDGGWCLVDPGHGPITTAEPEVVEIVKNTDGGCVVSALEDGETGPADPVPGERHLDGEVGDLVFAVRVDDTPRWTALSTPMAHLRSLYAEGTGPPECISHRGT